MCELHRRRRAIRTLAPRTSRCSTTCSRAAGRQVRPAHRGHRSDPRARRLRADDLRRAALDRPVVGRGSGCRRPVRAVSPERARRSTTASTRGILLDDGQGVSLLLHRGAAREGARCSSKPAKSNARLRPPLPRSRSADGSRPRSRRRGARRSASRCRCRARSSSRIGCAARSRATPKRSTTRCCSSRTACRRTTSRTSSTIT